jgi:hypothetical protein
MGQPPDDASSRGELAPLKRVSLGWVMRRLNAIVQAAVDVWSKSLEALADRACFSRTWAGGAANTGERTDRDDELAAAHWVLAQPSSRLVGVLQRSIRSEENRADSGTLKLSLNYSNNEVYGPPRIPGMHGRLFVALPVNWKSKCSPVISFLSR